MDEIKKIIETSGNNFHCKVLNHLKSLGWHVLVSPYYTDNISDKPREIDLIAEKAFEYGDSYSGHKGTVNAKLFIECKFIPQKNVFWFHDKDMQKASELVVKNTPLRDNNIYKDKHHYLSSSNRVAKLFASESKRAAENEIIYKALNQSLNAMVYNRWDHTILPTKKGKPHRNITSIEYPVIVCNSFNDFYSVDIDSDREPEVINDNFLLEVNYAYIDTNKSHRNRYFLIDIVSFNKLTSFLKVIESDINAIKNIL
ncbi:MAG: hypothetical protein OEZ39_00630 [Gammaproteobacteria bacterium]|nr:hypothetical protein [Gammaproteobacteria bacterium]